jgi:hypothetical protein
VLDAAPSAANATAAFQCVLMPRIMAQSSVFAE